MANLIETVRRDSQVEADDQPALFIDEHRPAVFPARAAKFPEFRYMGSKHRLLHWLHSIFADVNFQTASDPFCGAGSVSFLLKAMGKSVAASDFLNFPVVIASAVIANSSETLTEEELQTLGAPGKPQKRFIADTFKDIFFTSEDLLFLDLVWERLPQLASQEKRDLALAALIRSCMKKQPRGVFTVGSNTANGDLRYDDGRRDVHLPLNEHFLEQASVLSDLVFDNGRANCSVRRSALDGPSTPCDLVYFDPPYVPRSDDNCYIKRYHFLEGLSNYWQDGTILETSKVKKLAKRKTPFSYRSTALEAFDTVFRLYADSIIALSYSSNGYPDREELEKLLKKYKPRVEVFERPHRYHFGTHSSVERALTTEYVLLGMDA
jgi:adenine-specific DNA-methyltransferase